MVFTPNDFDYRVDMTDAKAVEEELAVALATKRSTSSKVSNRLSAVGKFLEEHSTSTTLKSSAMKTAQTHISELEIRQKAHEETLSWLVDLFEADTTHKVKLDDPKSGDKKLQARANDARGELDVMETDCTKAIESLYELMEKGATTETTPAAERTRAASPTEKKCSSWKPNAAYKPPVLESDASPQDLENWVRQFEAYIPRADVESEGILKINFLLEELLSPTVRGHIGFDKARDVHIFSNGDGKSIMDQLEASWLKRYPIIKRRRELFEPQDSTNFTQMSAKIMALARKADLKKMCKEETIIAYIHIAWLYKGGPKYAKILDKIIHNDKFQSGEITVDDIAAIASVEEMAQHLVSPPVPSEPTDTVYKLQQGNAGGNRGNQRRKKPLDPKLEELKKKGLCFRCAREHGKKEKCPALGNICKNCQKKNHFEAACCSKAEPPTNKQ